MKIAVIGAGLSGSVFTKNVSNIDAEITVFESGPEHGFRTLDSVSKSSLGNTLAFGNGGTTNLWHNGLISNPESANTKDLNDQVATFLGYSGDCTLSEAKSKYIRELSDCLDKGIKLDAIYYPNVRQRLKVEASKVIFNSKVYKLDIRDNLIRGLWYKAPDGEHYFECDRVVVCAGGIETKYLLEASGIDVGLKVVDHPMGFIGKIRVKREYKQLFSKISQRSLPSGTLKSCIVADCNGLQGAFYLRSCQTLSNSLGIHKYRSKLGTTSGLERLKLMVNIRLFHPDILREIFNYITGWEFFGRNYTVMFIGEQLGDESSGEVSDMKLRITSSELNTFNKMKDSVYKYLSPYLDSANFCDHISEEWLWSAAHYSFGLSGDQENNGRECFLGVSGLYVSGGASVNRHFYTNTGLEIAANAYKLARSMSTEV
jgi:hypothetical protein